MALQLGEDLKARDWSVKVVGSDREVDALSTMRAVSPPKRPIFLVVDYAETRTGLVELLREVARDPARVRVLLIARSVGDWWVQLGSDVAAVRQLVQATPRWELSPRVDPSRSSAELVRSAVPHFAAALRVAPPAAVEVSVPDDAPLLVVHAAALVAVLRLQDPARPAAQRSGDIGAVLDELLGHEMHYWERSAARAGLGGLSPVVLQRAVAVACLLSAVDESDAAALLRRVPDLRDDEPLRRRLARWLRQLYPRTPATGVPCSRSWWRRRTLSNSWWTARSCSPPISTGCARSRRCRWCARLAWEPPITPPGAGGSSSCCEPTSTISCSRLWKWRKQAAGRWARSSLGCSTTRSWFR
jgi:hypothetical protein